MTPTAVEQIERALAPMAKPGASPNALTMAAALRKAVAALAGIKGGALGVACEATLAEIARILTPGESS